MLLEASLMFVVPSPRSTLWTDQLLRMKLRRAMFATQVHQSYKPDGASYINQPAAALVDGHCAPTTVERAGERQTRRTGAGYQDAGWCHVTVG